MVENNKPLYTLTVREYRQLLRDEFKKMPVATQDEEETDIEDVEWLQEQTGYTKGTIHVKISKGEIPVHRKGKPLEFSKKLIKKWLELGRPTVIELQNILNAEGGEKP
jgi:hypothetical protein